MRKVRTHNRPMASINIVPYIDVMLVLLIIFMVAAPLITQGVQVDLPETTSEQIKTNNQAEPVIVTIDKSGKIYLNISQNSKNPVSEDELLLNVGAHIKSSPSSVVLIKGDIDASHGDVITVMSWLKNAGINEIGIITTSKP